jgi:kinesin family protein 22
MEAKLRAWLETKGKTNSSQQRLGPLNSPLVKKTPGSIITSAKKSVNFNTSVKEARTSTKKDAKQTTERSLVVFLYLHIELWIMFMALTVTDICLIV